MTTTKVHLEDVTRAARQGIVLALACSMLATVSMLAAGLAPGIAGLAGITLLAVGCASGGFGLVARVSMQPPRLPHRADSEGGTPVPPLQVPQPR